jgi:uncharacterized protein
VGFTHGYSYSSRFAGPEKLEPQDKIMNTETIRNELRSFLDQLDIIDAHEHLVPESERLRHPVSVLTLVAHYAWVDMVSAGLPPEYSSGFVPNSRLTDASVPLEERWRAAWPSIEHIRYGTYYRPTLIALRDIYGIEHLDNSNWEEASERIIAANRPGIYNSILRERCHIRRSLVQNGRIEGQDPPGLFSPVYSEASLLRLPDRSFVDFLSQHLSTPLPTYPSFLEALGSYLSEVRTKGGVGFKIGAWFTGQPDFPAAEEQYADLLAGKPSGPALYPTTLDLVCRKAAEWDWPVCVHTGVWGDFRGMEPRNALDLVMRYPDTRFDIYHLGMPEVRECIFIAKNFRNAFLNLCWCYALSQDISRRAVNEIIDLVPVNKVFGFGGDYMWDVENVYGHLVMARETLSEALAERVTRGHIDLDGARHILKLWMHDNPTRFYGLE